MTPPRDPARIDTAYTLVRASPERVYRAMMDCGQLLRWLPPEGMAARIEGFDARAGGGYRMTLTYTEAHATPGKTSEHADVVEVRFVELVPARRIVQDVFFESDDPDYAEPMRMAWDLEPEADATRVRVTCRNVPPGISAADHQLGLRASLDNLAALLDPAGTSHE